MTSTNNHSQLHWVNSFLLRLMNIWILFLSSVGKTFPGSQCIEELGNDTRSIDCTIIQTMDTQNTH